jgi:hypothetical protein
VRREAGRYSTQAGLLAAVMLGALACTPPPGQEVSIYTRNDSLDEVVLEADPQIDPEFVMPVAGGGLCVRLPPAWSMRARDFVLPDGSAGPVLGRISDDDVPAGKRVAIWVRVLADGVTVQTGRGVPPWWSGQPQVCS